MKKILFFVGLLACSQFAMHRCWAAEWDIVIQGGTVIDGTGGDGYKADIGIRNGIIVFVGQAEGFEADEVIEAEGLMVTPGFIDVHNHSPETLLEPVDYTNPAYITQGVTTAVAGADGNAAPAEIRRSVDYLTTNGFGTNYAYYVGHNGIRSEVMGNAQRQPTDAELDRMKALVREGMEMGAVGFSTGLMYEPGMFSNTEEVIELAREVAPYDGTYDSHTRNPVFEMIKSETEAIEVGIAADIPAKLAHLKAVGLLNRGHIGEIIDLVEKARAAGHDIVSDQYPYDGASTMPLHGLFLLAGYPGMTEPDRDRVLPDVQKILKDSDLLPAIKMASEQGIDGGFSWIKAVGYGSMRIVDAPDFKDLIGQNLQTLANEQGKEPFDLLVDLVLRSERPVLITVGSIDEQEVQELLVQPWNMISSDGAYVVDGRAVYLHPRSTGTYPRVLGRYVRELKLLSLPEAIRKMTSLPADHLRLYDRGRIKVGLAADIVIFNAETVRDKSTWTEPGLYCEGITDVLVNGVPVVRDAEITGATPGKFIMWKSPVNAKVSL